MPDDKEIARALSAIVGKENASADIFERVSYGQDAMGPDLKEDKIPVAVVRPGSSQEIAGILKYATQHSIPVVVHGSGSSFKGGPRPKSAGSIVLNTSRLDSLHLYEADCYFEVGAGMNQYNLETTLAERGYLLPMNTGNKHAATIGGGVAVNTIGHMVDACVGKIGDHVMGLEVVLPTGQVIETGTQSLRRPAGLDLTRLFVGSEGLFGVITKIRMRLVPMPRKAYVVGFFKQPEDVAQAFVRIYQEKLPPPLYGELLGRNTAAPAFKNRGLGEPPGDMALATTIAFSQEEADRQAAEILRVFKAQGAVETHVVTSPEEQVALWEARDFITNMRQREEGQPRVRRGGGFEMGVPLTRMPEFFTYIRSGLTKYPNLSKAGILFYGHVGASGPHVAFSLPTTASAADEAATLKEARALEKEMTVSWGGMGGELGQTAARISAWKTKYGEDAYSVVAAMKKAIDPANILNRGNLEGEGYAD